MRVTKLCSAGCPAHQLLPEFDSTLLEVQSWVLKALGLDLALPGVPLYDAGCGRGSELASVPQGNAPTCL